MGAITTLTATSSLGQRKLCSAKPRFASKLVSLIVRRFCVAALRFLTQFSFLQGGRTFSFHCKSIRASDNVARFLKASRCAVNKCGYALALDSKLLLWQALGFTLNL